MAFAAFAAGDRILWAATRAPGTLNDPRSLPLLAGEGVQRCVNSSGEVLTALGGCADLAVSGRAHDPARGIQCSHQLNTTSAQGIPQSNPARSSGRSHDQAGHQG
jgi:hypothetical protein